MHGYSRSNSPTQRIAFTLVELLVVITIIGILIALLLPAVQAAREAARKLQCTNNLKQVALGCLTHENVHGYFPSGGWGIFWTGDAEHGFGKKQPGGWVYSVLPYIEQEAIYGLGAGAATETQRQAANAQRIATPIAAFNCPTRRPSVAYNNGTHIALYHVDWSIVTGQARSDYAANLGDDLWNGEVYTYGPTTFAEGDSWTPDNGRYTGIMYFYSETRQADISDGTTNTYLLGEKGIQSDYYDTGDDWGDDSSMYTGQNDDSFRVAAYHSGSGPTGYTYYPPAQDPAGVMNYRNFGSAHSSGFNAALCDGSVRSISYSIDPETHRCLANRKDGSVIDGAKF